MRHGARMARLLSLGALVAGCTAARPLPPGALIQNPQPAPQLPPPPAPAELPAPPEPPKPAKGEPGDPPKPAAVARPGAGADSPLALREVLQSVEQFFPLLYAVEQERGIAEGQRVSAEGGFDPTLRARAVQRGGTFSSGGLDIGLEQPLTAGGVTTFAGWRLGQGNFPIYSGDRKTAELGEFRGGFGVPLLAGREIDPRRARVRAAQIQEQLADPAVRRARLDFFRNSAQAYWAWQTAGAQYRVASQLVELAATRQEVVDARQKAGQISASAPALNRRLIAGRREARLAAERQLQQAAIRLSLFLRDSNADPVVPPAAWLLPDLLALDPPRPDPTRLKDDVAGALARRPELVRFQLEKERRSVELQLATNQTLPALNAFAAVSQDAGSAKKTLTGVGPFATDRTAAEAGATFELPIPRRDALGRVQVARAQLAQLLAQERYQRDDIAAQVQDAVSELVQTAGRVAQAREELREANRVLEIEGALFDKEQTTLFELNLQEVAAAEARAKVAGVVGLSFAAAASYLAAIGQDAPPAGAGGAVVGGCVLPTPPQ